jgi:hypothetical protein
MSMLSFGRAWLRSPVNTSVFADFTEGGSNLT